MNENQNTEPVETELLPTTDELKAKYSKEMKGYKTSLYIVVGAVVLYVISMFILRNNWITLLCCIPLIGGAFWNSKQAKKIRKINEEYAKVQEVERRARAAENGELDPDDVQVLESSEIVTNAGSLNDLPKEYTVLDNEELGQEPVKHIILSPYGVAIVDPLDHTAQMKSMLEELNIEAPVFSYLPQDDMSELVIEIQRPRDVALSEKDIYRILYHLRGLD